MSSAKDKVLRVIAITATAAIIIAFIAGMLGANYCVKCFTHSASFYFLYNGMGIGEMTERKEFQEKIPQNCV